MSGNSTQSAGIFGTQPQVGSQSQQPFSPLGTSAEIRGNNPNSQGHLPSNIDRFSQFHPSTSGNFTSSPLKGPPLPSGFDPGRSQGHLHGNIPFSSTLSQGSEGDTNLSKSMDSAHTVNEKDITEVLSRPDLASSIAEDLLKQFSQNSEQPHSDIQSSQNKVSADLRTGESSSAGVGIHSSSTQDFNLSAPSIEKMLKLDSEVIKCDTDSAKYGSLPKLNIHMSGEQILRACKGLGKILAILMPPFLRMGDAFQYALVHSSTYPKIV